MTAILKVDTIQDTSGNNIINESSDTITIGASGDTTNIVGTLQNNGAALVTGKVLQVVQGTPDTTSRASNSTSFVTGSNTIFVNITPSSTSSKIYVLASGAAYGSTATYNSLFTIYRDSTNLATDSFNIVRTNADNSYGNYCMSVLDSPSTTSQIKYQIYFKSEGAANTVQLNLNGTQGLITAFEIAG